MATLIMARFYPGKYLANMLHQALVVALALYCWSPSLSVACSTTLVTVRGNLDTSLPVVSESELPSIESPISQQISSAQFVTSSYFYDSLGNAHLYYLLLFHLDNPSAPWLPRVVMDEKEILGGVAGKPSVILFSAIPTELLKGDDSINSIGSLFVPVWNNQASDGNIFVRMKLAQSQDITHIELLQDGGSTGCSQNATTDFDGDGKDDVAVWRPSIGFWAIKKSSTDNREMIWQQWGLPGDIPMPGDYTGDGKADLVVWRPSNGNWYICKSELGFDCFRNNGNIVYQFGLPGDQPIKADYDGDRILDLAVYRSVSNSLYVRQSSSGMWNAIAQQWGLPGDVPLFGGIGR